MQKKIWTNIFICLLNKKIWWTYSTNYCIYYRYKYLYFFVTLYMCRKNVYILVKNFRFLNLLDVFSQTPSFIAHHAQITRALFMFFSAPGSYFAHRDNM
jgi:hypothetical protein